MKKPLLFILLFFSGYNSFSQAYIPMPVDSAVWRYRIYDVDYIAQIFDQVLFLNGRDTVANGYTYHQLISRTCKQTGAVGFDPPIVPVDATGPDFVYGSIREGGKQVFLLAGASEKLLFDFTAGIGDSIPAYESKVMVTAIDSILIDGVYHKRYLTTDTGYFVIEGVGSNRGIIPDLNDGGSDIAFICLKDSFLTYTPNPSLPCTYVYPEGYVSGVTNVNAVSEINIFPVPANDVLHITVAGIKVLSASIFNCIGQVIWQGMVNEKTEIPVCSWPAGTYYIQFTGDKTGFPVRKIIVN